MPRFQILDYSDTPLGALCLRRRELLSRPGTTVFEVTLDHEFLMSSLNTDSERALAERALAFHPGHELRVLVGGLGLGYTAWEVLRCDRVARVEVVEFLPGVISWLRRGLIPLAGELSSDARLRVVEGDIYGILRSPPISVYDLVLIDVDHNPDETLHVRNNPFYSVEGLERAAAHLTPGGVLGVWSSESSETFLQTLTQVFPDVRSESVVWQNELIDEEQRNEIYIARKDV